MPKRNAYGTSRAWPDATAIGDRTQAEATRRLGVTQPRVNDLLRGRLEKFSIDALIVYLARVGVPVRIAMAPRRRKAAA